MARFSTSDDWDKDRDDTVPGGPYDRREAPKETAKVVEFQVPTDNAEMVVWLRFKQDEEKRRRLMQLHEEMQDTLHEIEHLKDQWERTEPVNFMERDQIADDIYQHREHYQETRERADNIEQRVEDLDHHESHLHTARALEKWLPDELSKDVVVEANQETTQIRVENGHIDRHEMTRIEEHLRDLGFIVGDIRFLK